MDLKLRCSTSGCDCRNFSASPLNKESLRQCDACGHSWITHLLEKLLTARDDALSVFDVCSLALYGTHALPIRLKIVIERLLATLTPDEIDKILRSFGWSPQDLARGYMIQDSRGVLLGRWAMLPREEEILILQQFLRFQATRVLSFALLREDFPVPNSPVLNNHPPKTSPPTMNLHGGSYLSDLMHKLSPPPPPVKSPLKTPSSQILNLSTQSSGSEDEELCRNGLDLTLDLRAKSHRTHSSSPKRPRDMEAGGNLKEPGEHHQTMSGGGQVKKSHSAKRPWIFPSPQIVNPVTGKRRVQCSVCLKTFCDKGALKIHFSAVHLREMHKCTVSGCTMMFSSRRSRNRHSANPNPKLHTPHMRRKISPHDGRKCQPLLSLNNPLLLSSIRFPPFLPNVSPKSLFPHDAEKPEGHEEESERIMMDEEDEMMYSPEEEDEVESVESKEEAGKKDGARKRKLKNPVRLHDMPDDSNDDFCCYDDGTEVSHEEEDEKKDEDEEEDHLGRLESLPIFTSPSNNSDCVGTPASSGTPKSEDEENNGGSSPGSDGEIPVDRENPRRCLTCGKVFQNHFGVRTHYQNVHLKLMHKCTVDGCNAAFPSKRSRDRHSSNLNLHRKLLSTSDFDSNGDDLRDGEGRFNHSIFQNGSNNQLFVEF